MEKETGVATTERDLLGANACGWLFRSLLPLIKRKPCLQPLQHAMVLTHLLKEGRRKEIREKGREGEREGGKREERKKRKGKGHEMCPSAWCSELPMF